VNGAAYLADVTRRFREAKAQCDRALAQVPFERWSHRLDPGSNSITTLVLHLSGNMLSRWTDFLTSDGEKPFRDRDAEFEDTNASREELLARWERGWDAVFGALASLTDADLDRTITIRSQPHSVVEAINRQVAHYAHHAGQVVMLAKHLAGDRWQTLSVPRGGSSAYNDKLMGGGGPGGPGRS
jgi:uncharacterized damage-inducible protein DinB